MDGTRGLLLLAALLLDALVGDPDWLWRRLPHPVVLLGRAVARLERDLNRPGAAPASARLAGVAALALLLAGAIAVGLAVEALGWWPLELALAAALLAQRSLYEHVAAVAEALGRDGLAGGRRAVARIVGRDPERLDTAGVCRAAIESLAENFSDGIVAPAFWYAVGGLPGLIAYKALNTADSMIGHRSERHRHFGWAAARLDDLANLPASRLSALLVALARPRRLAAALAAVARDAGRHRSPNAGWPEAALAGALGLALAGPRHYAAGAVEDAWMNAGGRREAGPGDIERALALYRDACRLGWLLAALLATAAVLV
ncbi:adenosylcobinamide-phosphate synthase [Tistlia consotensis]|uniref:Cobalamin biosynthesis protein CobD n=1 Tax=Tistlia consotensis USBA 355 TaxID=560819 RepID=A0A1Y6BWY7_9PROT|nr:adenosylcobinamide-phosphate synthase CbiB [Tistlia consotensis]SMF33115.1 adenosylcobinamide-phosphate synthase [Tistlia consotensis USBA 355]SNR69385.1 adenosylcobinamide-phosphate synthase [Tistlia consotensis]